MGEIEARCLDAFPQWLAALGEDTKALADLLAEDQLGEDNRRVVAETLNHLFKFVDLIPDGIEDLGYLDDAFIFRVGASQLSQDGHVAITGRIQRLAEDAALVKEFLGDDYERLEKYFSSLADVKVRDRSVADIVSDDSVRRSVVNDARGWANSYQAPSFARDEKNLVKLRSFLTTKLPK